MATLALTFPGIGAGASARQLAFAVTQATAHLHDAAGANGSIVVTIDNAPSSGAASVQVTAPAGYVGPVVRVG
jgi:hypothetical protein